MKTLNFRAVICGHIKQEGAESICEIIRNSIKHTELSGDDLYYVKNLTKLPNKTVHTYQEKSKPEGTKVNPNSAIQCYF